MQFQLGANVDQNTRVYIGTMTATALGLRGNQSNGNQISISTPDSANMAIATVDSALTKVSRQRADLGAYQNRFSMGSVGRHHCQQDIFFGQKHQVVKRQDFKT